MTSDILVVFGLIGIVSVLLIIEVVRVDVLALFVLAILGLTRVIPSQQIFSGFSSEAVISLISAMIMAGGLEKSGIMHFVTRWILYIGGHHENRIRMLLMFSAGVVSGFLRSVGSLALFLPVVNRIRRRAGISKARLLLPIGFSSILGSTLTMVGSGPLILLNPLLAHMEKELSTRSIDFSPLGFFSVLPIGVGLLVVGILYFFFLERFILPKREKRSVVIGPTFDYFQKTYGVGGRIFECHVPCTSPLVDKTVKEWERLLGEHRVVIGLQAEHQLSLPPIRGQQVVANADVAILGKKEEVEEFAQVHGLIMRSELEVFSELLHPGHAGLAEVVIPPSSPLVGQELHTLHIRRNFGVQVLALLRGNQVLQMQDFQGVVLRPGDLLGMYTSWTALAEFEKNPDFLVVTADFPRESKRTEKASLGLFFFLFSLFLILFTHTPLSVSFLVGAVGMIFSGVITIDEAYQSVSWSTVFLLAGLIPLGLAMHTTGADVWLIKEMLYDFSHLPVLWLEIGIVVLTTLFSLLISNVGATIILVPLVVRLAINIGADPKALALLVAISASNVFLFPTHHAHALIMGLGNYRVRDFMRAGIGMTFLYGLVTLVLLPYAL